MHYFLSARHFQLTEANRKYVERHIVDAVQNHADEHSLTRVEVQLGLGQRDARYGCHVMVQLPRRRAINITEENKDMYAAIDLAEKRLVRQLVDTRQKELTKARHPRKFSWGRVLRALRTAR